MAFRASEFAEKGERERERKRKLQTHTDRRKEHGEGETKAVWGISENAPVTSKAERLLKDGYNRLTPKHN